MMKKLVLILGANGMIGELILNKCLESNEIGTVVTVTRKALAMNHEKLKNIIHHNFLDFTSIENVFAEIDICYYCLGVYTGAVSNNLFFEITVDYTKSVVALLKEKSPNVRFCFLSGMGAYLTEKSNVPFAKAKGMAENYLLKIGLGALFIFRPGYIYPVTKRKEPNAFYTIIRWFYPFLNLIYPNIGLSSEQLAKSMFKAGFENAPTTILENKAIKSFIVS